MDIDLFVRFSVRCGTSIVEISCTISPSLQFVSSMHITIQRLPMFFFYAGILRCFHPGRTPSFQSQHEAGLSNIIILVPSGRLQMKISITLVPWFSFRHQPIIFRSEHVQLVLADGSSGGDPRNYRHHFRKNSLSLSNFEHLSSDTISKSVLFMRR